MNAHHVDRRRFLGFLPVLGLAGCTTDELNTVLGSVLSEPGGAGLGLSSADAAAGIRAALQQGIGSAITQVGRTNGYFGDPTIRIPLPSRLASVRDNLSRFGLAGALNDLELQLNRGAEAAAPQARSIFVSAVRSLSVNDAIGIVRGGPTSATDYFRQRTSPSLTRLFTPVMTTALQRAGAIQSFDQVIAQLSRVPLAPQLGADAKTELIAHGVDRGLGGLFAYIGEEEAAIRANPAKRTSAILRKVFS